MVVCVLVPRFPLQAALRGRGEGPEALVAEPVALAPEPGGAQSVGEVSPAAEAFGMVPGMRVGEALARCPELRLVPPDPEGARALWSAVLDRLERIGAAPESDRSGEAFFEAEGLLGLHGGHLEGVLAAARRTLDARRRPPPGPGGSLAGVAAASGRAGRAGAASGRASGAPVRGVRLGAGPSRFAAYAAALQARPRRGGGGRGPAGARVAAGAVVVPAGAARAFLAPLPVGLLRTRAELAGLPEVLDRLGVRTLGELAALPTPSVAERFGHPGMLALDLACGRDTPLTPRRPPEPVSERLELPEAGSGEQLGRALELLVARLLARPERRGRTVRALALTARFVEGGTWRARATLRQASAEPERIRLALAPRLDELPAPAEAIGLEVEAFGPPAHDQSPLAEDPGSARGRRARLGEAVRQARQAAGDGAAMRALQVDPGSRVPERRAVLAPFPAEGGAR